MTTLLVTENFPPAVGGTSRWFWDVYSRLPRGEGMVLAGARAGDRAFDEGNPLLVDRIPLSCAEWGVLDRPARPLYRLAYQRVCQLAERRPIRRLHAARAIPEGWIALRCRRRLGLRFVCSVQGEELGSAAKSRQLRWMTRRVLRGADRLVAVSRYTADRLARDWGIPRDKIEVTYPGVDTETFAPAPHDPEVRARLGWGNRPVVLTVSRLQKRKGHDVMVEALDIVRRSLPAVLWAVIGDGAERLVIESAVDRLGLRDHVAFYGELDDVGMIAAYQQCDLFALPGREVNADVEGLGIVLLEAQACGRAVVVGRSGGSPEAVDDGRTARVLDCRSPGPLAETVAELLRSPELRQRMGELGRAWAVERFGAEDGARRLREALERVGPEGRNERE